MNSHRARELGELKKQALNFYQTNADVPKRIEEALNSLFYDSPDDVYGYLADYFNKFIKPTYITKVAAKKSALYDSKSQPIFSLEIFCQEKNSQNKVVSINSSAFSPADAVHDASRIQTIQDDDAHRLAKFNEVVDFINNEIHDLVKHFSPFEQAELDEKLSDLFKGKQAECMQSFIEKLSIASHSQLMIEETKKAESVSPKSKPTKQTSRKTPNMSSVSQVFHSNPLEDLDSYLNSNFKALWTLSLISKAICVCSIKLLKVPAFKYINDLSTKLESFEMPSPLITILQNGKGFLGKQQLIKEYILLPKPGLPINQALEAITKIHRNIRDNLYQSKTLPGAANRNVTDSGSLACLLDTPHQGLDMIEAAITGSCTPDIASRIGVALNISANEIHDHEKSRYEIGLNLLKTGEELIEVYADLIAKYPRIVMIIDPFLKTDQLNWYKLHTKISKNCFVASNNLVTNDSLINRPPPHELSEINELGTPRPPNQSNSSLTTQEPLLMPINFLKYENAATVTDSSRQVNELKSRNLLVGYSCSFNEPNDDFLADLSVGNQVNFIKIGGLGKNERVCKLNRLIQIEEYLQEKKMLQTTANKEFKFSTVIDVPIEFQAAIQQYQHSLEEVKPVKNLKK